MNCKQAKEIPIVEYLIRIGHSPSKTKNYNVWFNSPFRNESKPSFKVDTNINCWYDYGLGKGGNIIDLAMTLFDTNIITEALKHIDSIDISKISSFQQQKTTPKAIEIVTIKPLDNQNLITYIESRSISLETAYTHCCELKYINKDKQYYAIGFKNDKGGYELRSKTFKGCSSPKWITTINNDSNECLIFEGFIDYLSFIELSGDKHIKYDAIILNSITNLGKATIQLKAYKKLFLYLDNDTSGRKTTIEIIEQFPTAIDRSRSYINHKDVNEYLSSK